jgi:hypothetical protein
MNNVFASKDKFLPSNTEVGFKEIERHERPFTFTVCRNKKQLYLELDLSQTETMRLLPSSQSSSIVSLSLLSFLRSLPLSPRRRLFDWRNSNSNRVAQCTMPKCDTSAGSILCWPIGNPIRNINWQVLVSWITLFRTRVTWKFDGRDERENYEIQMRPEYGRIALLSVNAISFHWSNIKKF